MILLKKLLLATMFVAMTTPAWAIDFTPTGTVLIVVYTEPITNTDNSPLTDLAKTTVNSRVCPTTGVCTTVYTQVDVIASAISGGATVSKAVTISIAPGQENNVEVFATATDLSGNVSPESLHVVKRVDRLSPSAPK